MQRKSKHSNAVVFLLVLGVVHWAFGVCVQGEDGRQPLNELAAFERISQAIYNRPEMHGSWVIKTGVDSEVEGDAGQYVFTVIADSSHGDRQEKQVRNLLRAIPFDRAYRIADVVYLPMTSLMEKLNVEIEAHSNLDGCFVKGASYTRSRIGGQLLELYGRVVHEEQRIKITDLCGNLMQSFAEWKTTVDNSSLEIAPESSGTRLVEAVQSHAKGTMFFADGTDHFWNRRYSEADAAFQIAILESPTVVEYRYWRVLAKLTDGHKEKAYNHMVSLARRGQTIGVERRRVLRSLSRVQGENRISLLRMEFGAHAGRSFWEVCDDL